MGTLTNLIFGTTLMCATALHTTAQTAAQPDDNPKGEPLLKDLVPEKLASKDYAHMELQLNSSANATFENGEYTKGNFSLNGVRLQVSGNLADGVSYLFRQSFTQPYAPNASDKVSMAVEKALVNWDVNRHLQLTIGKQFMELGGYEFWVAANRVRFYSDFNSTIPCMQAGVTGYIRINDNHTVALQVLNNTNASEMEHYAYGFPQALQKTKTPIMGIIGYKGYLADRAIALHYGAGYGQIARDRQQLFLTAGNVWEKGPVLAYIDVMYSREGIDTKGLVSSYANPAADNGSNTADNGSNTANYDGSRTAQFVEYLTTIANIDYRISRHVNLYVKGTYETGRIYRDNGIYHSGRYNDTWSVQACAEYFPIKDRDLRFFLHGVYKNVALTKLGKGVGGSSHDMTRVSIGLEYVLPVF